VTVAGPAWAGRAVRGKSRRWRPPRCSLALRLSGNRTVSNADWLECIGKEVAIRLARAANAGSALLGGQLSPSGEPMAELAGKLGLVLGVANKRSIAWAIAQAWKQAGATLAFTYQGDRVKANVEELVSSFGPDTLLLPCDVTKDEEIDRVFGTVKERFGKLHLLLHSIAFAPREALEGEFIRTSREAFRIALEVSAYSLVALARAAAPLMTDGGSILAMTYYGSQKVIPHYNVMGVAKAALEACARYLAYDLGPKRIRVNCISAGPVNTLAARGIAGFTSILEHYQTKAPLRRNLLPEELGATAVFLASDGAAAITGQVIYVDCGYEIMGM
jgi:enoyl-[acyl-carrier protein] reductase I